MELLFIDYIFYPSKVQKSDNAEVNNSKAQKLMFNISKAMFIKNADELLTPENPILNKAKYRITAWLKSEKLKRYVYDLNSVEFEGLSLSAVADGIESLTTMHILETYHDKKIRQLLIRDIEQACKACKE